MASTSTTSVVAASRGASTSVRKRKQPRVVASSAAQRMVGFLCALGLFLIILFLLPGRVDTARLCGERGFRNGSSGECICSGEFYGEACEYRHCPFGESWFSRPLHDNERNQELVECSNMGYCNPLSGECTCRDGYEGRACERLICATTLSFKTIPGLDLAAVDIGASGPGLPSAAVVPDTDLRNTPPCSGHGRCKTMRDAGAEFDGLLFVRAPVNYRNWDADKIQNCVCDAGWEGYDCSRRSCPLGRDPTDSSTATAVEEVFVLQCRADSGYFALLVLGSYTEPIPFDADPALLQQALEAISLVGRVSVTTPALNSDGLPSVCSSSGGGGEVVASTQIRFLDHVGDRPPMLLTRNTSDTRQWPDGSTPLSLRGDSSGGGGVVLRMSTEHRLTCAPCASCFGKVYFTYRGSVSEAVNITAEGAAAAVQTAVAALEDLQSARWTNLQVNVTINNALGADQLCVPGVTSITSIRLFSDYGNIDFLDILDGSYSDDESLSSANLTLSTNAATGNVYECSNQGTCEYTSGICQCLTVFTRGAFDVRALSSNGRGGAGERGDCGYFDSRPSSCYFLGKDACGGHGYCANSTGSCICDDGYAGATCSLRQCPLGRAWYDEPTASDTAHGFQVCSGMGLCDIASGVCDCRDGYSGAACDIKDCPTSNSTGEVCNGHGRCVTTAQLFSFFDRSYGNVSVDYLNPGGSTWDAHRWSECLCSAHRGAGFFGDVGSYSVGPKALISGRSAGAGPLPGWSNWDCSLRNCPRGHTNTAAGGGNSVRSIQRVVCGLSSSRNSNSSAFFRLSLFGESTAAIFADYDAAQIADAISSSANIGNVSVWFANFTAVDSLQQYNRSTACHTHYDSSSGGFLVRFDSEFGDLPLLTAVGADAGNVTVSYFQRGNSTNLECGGPTVGFCNRFTGDCICNIHRASSDGTGARPGAAGDCAYLIPNPLSTDATAAFNGRQNEQRKKLQQAKLQQRRRQQ